METNHKEIEAMEKSILRIKRKFQEGIPSDKVFCDFFLWLLFLIMTFFFVLSYLYAIQLFSQNWTDG